MITVSVILREPSLNDNFQRTTTSESFEDVRYTTASTQRNPDIRPDYLVSATPNNMHDNDHLTSSAAPAPQPTKDHQSKSGEQTHEKRRVCYVFQDQEERPQTRQITKQNRIPSKIPSQVSVCKLLSWKMKSVVFGGDYGMVISHLRRTCIEMHTLIG